MGRSSPWKTPCSRPAGTCRSASGDCVEVVDRLARHAIVLRLGSIPSQAGRRRGGGGRRAASDGPDHLGTRRPATCGNPLGRAIGRLASRAGAGDPDGRTRFRWQAILRDGSNYVRQEIALLAHEGPRPVELSLLDLSAGDAQPCGIVDGSPLVSGNFFLACEHPLAKNQVAAGRAVCQLPLYDSPAAGLPKASAVIGVAPAGQLRRGFLYYLERERARPYRPFTYYISWFDIAAPGLKMNESQCLEVIEAFGNELAVKRGVKLDAFVFDDGWDDNQSLWKFHAGFPRGFAPLRDEAARYDAILGTWISPFGGYGKHKQRATGVRPQPGLRDQPQRLRPGRAQVLRGLPQSLRGHDSTVRDRLHEVRRHGRRLRRRTRHGVRRRHAGPGPTLRPAAPNPPRPVHQRHHRHLALAVLALPQRHGLARRRETSAIAAKAPNASSGSPTATGSATASARAAGRSTRSTRSSSRA